MRFRWREWDVALCAPRGACDQLHGSERDGKSRGIGHGPRVFVQQIFSALSQVPGMKTEREKPPAMRFSVRESDCTAPGGNGLFSMALRAALYYAFTGKEERTPQPLFGRRRAIAAGFSTLRRMNFRFVAAAPLFWVPVVHADFPKKTGACSRETDCV